MMVVDIKFVLVFSCNHYHHTDALAAGLPANAPVHVPAGASTHTSPPRLHRLLAVLITTVLAMVTMKVVGGCDNDGTVCRRLDEGGDGEYPRRFTFAMK